MSLNANMICPKCEMAFFIGSYAHKSINSIQMDYDNGCFTFSVTCPNCSHEGLDASIVEDAIKLFNEGAARVE